MVRKYFGRKGRTAIAVALTACVVCGSYTAIAGASPGAGWEVYSNTRPTNLPPGGKGRIEIEVFNIGAGAANSTVTVTDILPPGLTATNAGELNYKSEEGVDDGLGPGIYTKGSEHGEPWACSGTQVVTCTAEPGSASFPIANSGAGGGIAMRLAITVNVAFEPGVGGTFSNQVTVAGGGTPTPAVTTRPVTISSTPASQFAFTNYDAWFGNEDGTVDTQAGSHPYSATFSFDLATASRKTQECVAGQNPEQTCRITKAVGGEINTIEAGLPPGLVGDPHAVPQCTRAQLTLIQCPDASQIGNIYVLTGSGFIPFEVFNMVRPEGAPAEFGFNWFGIVTFLDSSVRTGRDYGITTHVNTVSHRG